MKSWIFWEMTSSGFLGDVYPRIQRNAGCDSGYVFYVSLGSRCVRFVLLVALASLVLPRWTSPRTAASVSGFHVAYCSGSFSDDAAHAGSFGASCGLDSVQFPLCLC